MLTDEKIMAQVVSGDIHKTAMLFERYHVKLYNYYCHSLMDESLSKDLTQNVFEKIIKYRNSYREENCFSAWMFRIANNVMYDHFRKEKSIRKRNEGHYMSTDQFVNPNEKLEKEEQKKLLHQAISQLAPDQREIIWLSRFEKMKYVQIAEMMDSTEAAVKVKVHRAMKKLKELYLKLEAT